MHLIKILLCTEWKFDRPSDDKQEILSSVTLNVLPDKGGLEF